MSLEAHIFALLEHERQDVRCAAALVLGLAGRGHAGAAKALLAHAADRDPEVRREVLEALIQLGPLPAAAQKTLLARIAPLCASADPEVSGRALRLLVGQAGKTDGKGAEAILEAQLASPHVPAAARHAAAALLCKAGTAAADAALLGVLGEGEVGEQVLQLLRAEIDGDAKVAHRIGERAERVLAKLPKDAPPARRGALLRLLGYLGREETLPLLLAAAGARNPAELRASAIAAMRRALARKGSHPKVIAALFELADDPDPHLAHTAVDTLAVAAIPPAMVARLAALIDARNPDARRLAATRLGQTGRGDTTAVPALVHALVTGDPAAQGAAARSLATAPGAGAAIVQALVELPDAGEAAARRLVAALVKPAPVSVDDRALELLAKRGERALRSDADRTGVVVLEALARLAPARYLALVLGRARKQRKQGDVAAAWRTLRPVLGNGRSAVPAAERFFAAVCGLICEAKGLLRAARTVDPVLVALRELAGEGFPVAKTLAKEKDVPDDARFALGFNLVESPTEDDVALGEDVLESIIAARPRGKHAVAARNKLALVRRARA